MEEKKLLLLFALEAQGLMKGYKLEVPVTDAFAEEKIDIHSQKERPAYKDASYYRTMKK